MASKEKKSDVYDSGGTQESNLFKEGPRTVFPSATNHKVGEKYECGENTTAIKLAEISIHVYQVQGQDKMGHSMSIHRTNTFDVDADTAIILTKIAKDCKNRYKNRKSK